MRPDSFGVVARRVFVLCAVVMLPAGCMVMPAGQTPSPVVSGTSTQPVGHRNVYTQDKDSAPATPRDVDYHAIPDAVPREEPRGKYGNKSPYTVLGKTYEVHTSGRGYNETGGASWYGEKFQGFRTSSMEHYDMYAMTAAHKTLPIPSYVRVTNLGNNRSVIVRVNDRGPFHEGRIIDLSWAAAQKLGYASTGTARVRVEWLDPVGGAVAPTAESTSAEVAATAPDNAPPPASWHGFCVQVGAWSQEASARRQAEDTARLLGSAGSNGTLNDTATVVIDRGADRILRVRVGPWANRAAAERMRDRLREAGVDDAIVLALP